MTDPQRPVERALDDPPDGRCSVPRLGLGDDPIEDDATERTHEQEQEPRSHDESDTDVPQCLAPAVSRQPEGEGVETEGDERQELGDGIEPPHGVLNNAELVRAEHLDGACVGRNTRRQALAQPDPPRRLHEERAQPQPDDATLGRNAGSASLHDGAHELLVRLPAGSLPEAREHRRAQRLLDHLVRDRAERGRRDVREAVGVVGEHVLDLGLDVDLTIDLVDRVVRDGGAHCWIVQHRRARTHEDIRVEHLTLNPHRENRRQRHDRRRHDDARAPRPGADRSIERRPRPL